MHSVIEGIETKPLGFAGNQAIFALVGKKSNKLLGIQCQEDTVVRNIFFSDIDRLLHIAKNMTGGN